MQSNTLQLNTSWSCSGVPLLAGGISFQAVHSGLGLTPSFLQWLFEILAFTQTLISACRCMSSHLSRVASQSYVSYAAFDDLSHHLCISCSLPWTYRNWTTVMRHWLVSLLNRLQFVINAAARSITGLRRSEHITDALASFHWLGAPERIKFKLTVFVYRALHGTAPPRYTIGPASVRRRFAIETSRPAALVDLQSP